MNDPEFQSIIDHLERKHPKGTIPVNSESYWCSEECEAADCSFGPCDIGTPIFRAENVKYLIGIIEGLRQHMTNSQNTIRMVLDELPDEQRFQIIKSIGEKRQATRETA